MHAPAVNITNWYSRGQATVNMCQPFSLDVWAPDGRPHREGVALWKSGKNSEGGLSKGARFASTTAVRLSIVLSRIFLQAARHCSSKERQGFLKNSISSLTLTILSGHAKPFGRQRPRSGSPSCGPSSYFQNIDVFLTRYVNSSAGHHPIVDNLMIVATNVTIPAMVLVIVLRWWSRVG